MRSPVNLQLQVYPRVGGGNAIWTHWRDDLRGLSPRGRGKLRKYHCIPFHCGSIPAWAGETARTPHPCGRGAVYPRVGGGNDICPFHMWRALGLSPRGRGKLFQLAKANVAVRSIPAWAGETPPVSRRTALGAVYPRVGGGNPIRTRSPTAFAGLSPRGRGKRHDKRSPDDYCRSIPAWAGETKTPTPNSPVSKVYPRVGGGNNWAKIA